MPTDTERREVAARLRALPIDTYAAIKEWAKDGLFVDANLSDEADYSQIHNAVLECFPAEYMHPGDRRIPSHSCRTDRSYVQGQLRGDLL